jgi:hypothetical protein
VQQAGAHIEERQVGVFFFAPVAGRLAALLRLRLELPDAL